MNTVEMNKWVDAYIAYQTSKRGNKDYAFWPVMKFFSLMPEKPQHCWTAILEILYREPPEQVLESLAAWPLEDLIEDHGEKFIVEIEKEANINQDFKQLLKGVWESSTPEIWNRILKARGD